MSLKKRLSVAIRNARNFGSIARKYRASSNRQWSKAKRLRAKIKAQEDAAGIVPGSKPGSPIIGGTVGGAHETGGLPGFPARDWFAPSGTPCVAPVNGTVTKLSGHDPKLGAVQGAGGPLGWSVYIHGTDGRDYYLTHMGSRTVVVGSKVRQGQKIGTVADYHSFGRADHIHMGIHG